ncbi:DUF3970 family protein [Intestinibacter bartlettii]|uniref:DUF3970 family protein n=1 Tax=Intestinibacter bartlettii TaxID=261299 RepID=UPI000820CCFB|nr:DUF3970 family protein [Intestinibacter bartlettii]SCJ11453.1 Uncharacterised protein [uncultured Clostridium sp.]
MIKIRITYHDKNEVDKVIKKIEDEFDVISISRPYRNTRGNNKYSRIYIDLNLKK